MGWVDEFKHLETDAVPAPQPSDFYFLKFGTVDFEYGLFWVLIPVSHAVAAGVASLAKLGGIIFGSRDVRDVPEPFEPEDVPVEPDCCITVGNGESDVVEDVVVYLGSCTDVIDVRLATGFAAAEGVLKKTRAGGI